jgi:hypothetical protein
MLVEGIVRFTVGIKHHRSVSVRLDGNALRIHLNLYSLGE